MSVLSEKIELLGKGCYKDIPDTLTLKSIPTISELDYVGAEDFDQTMIDKILPQSVEEQINFNDLLEIDYQWVCRCLRILNYGPFHTTNAIYCESCGSVSRGEYVVNLQTIPCIELPKGFVNEMTISKDAFMDFDGDIVIKLPTIKQILTAYADKAFQTADGRINRELARICYMIKSIKGNDKITPVDAKLLLNSKLSPADYILLKGEVNNLTNYGLRAGGTAQCPKCGSTEANFVALTDDRFFRPTVGDLREWKNSKRTGTN